MGFGQAIGSLYGAVGDRYQGKMAKVTGEANARTLEQQAETVRSDGAEDLQRLRKMGAAAQGEARAAIAASGITSDGSGLAGELTAAKRFEQEIADAGVKTEREARGLEHQAAMSRYEGMMKKRGHKTAMAGGLLSGAIGLAQGGVNTYNTLFGGKRDGK